MKSLLVVVKLATSNFPLAQAVYMAHQAAGARPYLVDFPGLDNPRWADRHVHSVGRFALLYGDAELCHQVRERMDRLRERAAANQEFAVLRLAVTDLTELGLWDGSSTVRVRRHALRKASLAAARKTTERLAAKFAREGRTLQTPLVERVRCIIDEHGRWGAVLHPGTPQERIVKTVLTLPSSSGRHFSNALSRERSQDVAFFGARDSYGFSAGADGGSVPKVDERKLFAALIGEDVQDEPEHQSAEGEYARSLG